MLSQMVLNQNKDKGQEKEEPRRRRNPDFDENFKRDFLYQLHRLQQRDRTAEEYKHKMKLLMLRARIREEPKKLLVDSRVV